MEENKPVIQMMKTSEIVPYEKNAKIHDYEQVAKIAKQISTFGFDQPIVLEPTKVVIKGHGRLAAAKMLGLELVPVIMTNLTPEQAKAARIGDNKVAEAPWHQEFLKLELAAIKELKGMDLEMTGFSDEELEAMMADFEKTVDESVMDGASVEDKAQEMTKGVRKAIMIDFATGDDEKAYLLAKFFRDRGFYLGGMIMAHLEAEKSKVEAEEAKKNAEPAQS